MDHFPPGLPGRSPPSPPVLTVAQFLKIVERLPSETSSNISEPPATSETHGLTDLKTFHEWFKWDLANNPLSPINILRAVRIYHHATTRPHDPSHFDSQPIPDRPPVSPHSGPPFEPFIYRPKPMSWTTRLGIVWAIITTTVFASIAGWSNFFNYLITPWLYVTFIPITLLALLWWALPFKYFGTFLELLIHGRHNHRFFHRRH